MQDNDNTFDRAVQCVLERVGKYLNVNTEHSRAIIGTLAFVYYISTRMGPLYETMHVRRTAEFQSSFEPDRRRCVIPQTSDYSSTRKTSGHDNTSNNSAIRGHEGMKDE